MVAPMPGERSPAFEGVERALVLADSPELSMLLQADRARATAEIDGPAAVRSCARLLLEAGADPNSHTVEWGGEGQMSALFDAVERGSLALAQLLLDHGAGRDADAFYHACEQSDVAFLDLLPTPASRAWSTTSRPPRGG